MRGLARVLGACVVAILTGATGPAGAVGVGGFVTGAVGDADGGEGRATHLGAGLCLDTGTGVDRLFRYRLQVGYEHVALSFDAGPDESLDGVVTDHAFGFRLLGKTETQLWAGPELRAGWYGGAGEAGPALGLGAVAGLDVPLSPRFMLSVSGGYREVLHFYVLDDLRERLGHLELSLFWRGGAP